MSEAPNAGQIALWNEASGPTWVAMQAPLDRQLRPLGHAVMAALAPSAGERLLDIGCGAGETTIELAERVQPGGAVVGLDISRPLLEAARARAAPSGVEFIEADAQTHAFPPGSFDGVFSRFGVMFFADPVAAFTNIRRALKSGGRLAFVCWRAAAENPVMTTPMAAAAHLLPPLPPQADPQAPGPFAFADPERVRSILDAAGFADVAITPHDEKIGGNDLPTATEVGLRVGPLGALLRENPERRPAVVDAVRDALASHDGPDGVKLDSATWIVTARAP